MNEDEFQRFLNNIKEEVFPYDKLRPYYIESSLVRSLEEEQQLELLLFSKKYPIRVNSKQTLGLFSLETFLAELADKYRLLLE